jgi:hypothetical protein
MSSGSPISIRKEIAEAILDSEGQLLKIPDDDGGWSVKSINKAHIVSTDYDNEKERSEAENERMNTKELEAPKMTKEEQKRRVAMLNKMRQELIRKNVFHKK